MGTFAKGASAAADRARSASPASGGRILSNGRYSLLLTHAGTGASRCGDHALTRWTPDRIEDRSGLALYVRDLASGCFGSIGREPAGHEAERYETAWVPGTFTILRVADGLETRLEACVMADADAELRRLTITNRSERARRIELTTAAEIVLHSYAADAGHPAFSKLFVQTEYVADRTALLARRRPRGNDESHPLVVHALVGADRASYETDRARFVGRGGSRAEPAALGPDTSLSGTVGNVLDPIASLRCEVDLPAGGTAERTFVLAATPKREAAMALLERLAPAGAIERAFEASRKQADDALTRCSLTSDRAESLQTLLVGMLYGHPALRAPAALMQHRGGRVAPLAPLGIAPSRPLVVARSPNGAELEALRSARRYWEALGTRVDILVLPGCSALPRIGDGIRALTRDEATEELVATLASGANLWLDGSGLHDVARAMVRMEEAFEPSTNGHAESEIANGATPAEEVEPLRHFNGHGGFSADGTEYVIRMPWQPGKGLLRPPLPWVNVIATPDFGFIVSETGAGATWCANSREHRLSPWSNDPVLDPHGEALYLRDEDAGTWWSPLAGPAPQPVSHEMRHGFGYSVARHVADELDQEVTCFAHASEPVKISRVRVRNTGTRARRLSFWSYQRLVLGVLPEESAPYVVTANDPEHSMLLANNVAAGEFAERVAFAAAVAPPWSGGRQVTTNRSSFLGWVGSPSRPRSVASGGSLDGRAGAGLDPCFAERIFVEIAPGGSVDCTFLFGECACEDEARSLVAGLRKEGAIEEALDRAKAFWRDFVSGIRIETPEPALDLMVNGWLAYQTLSCRIWGRTAFYQSGGAFGFRDQLQDAVSLLYLRPELARDQILLHAAHQFVEGDVLHWWHPPLSKGIRTRFADDLLWLPLLVATYVGTTGDWQVLDERVRFLSGEELKEGEDERFMLPRDSGTSADVYEHCCRAIDRSLVVGERGLPLFGTGDWNDGMNRVGREGRGESVWMGFFLFATLGDFVPVCERRGDQQRAARYTHFRDQLRAALNAAGWDGEWYRRAYYDNGEAMGSASSDECRIDGLAQAWAVISKAAPPERARLAMEAVQRDLVSRRDRLIRLLTPAFQNTANDPGYIKGYVPGVRENGGQYTHAALWVVRAFAELGRHDLAASLLAMLSPVQHTSDAERLAVYRCEPYVVVADVYGEPPHVGRGGWSWYTGSAGWMLRVAVESVLGIRWLRGQVLSIRPCTPLEWPEFRVQYRIPGRRAQYRITVRSRPGASGQVLSATLNGQPVAVQQGAAVIPVLDGSDECWVELELGSGG